MLATAAPHRMGGSGSDPLQLLAGRPLVAHAVATLRASGRVGRITVVAPPGADVAGALDAHVPDHTATVLAVRGTRHDGLHAALAELGPEPTVVLHEASRPLAPPRLVDLVLDGLTAGAAVAVPVLPVAETVKTVDADGWVRSTVPRESLHQVQTPLAARVAELRCVRGGCDPADDPIRAVLGSSPATVPGDPLAGEVPWSAAVLAGQPFGDG